MRNKKRFEAAIKTAFPDAGVSWRGNDFNDPFVVTHGHAVFFDPEELIGDFVALLEMSLLSVEIWGSDGKPSIKIIEFKKPKRGNYEIIKTRGRPFNDETMDAATIIMIDEVLSFLAKKNGYLNLDS